LGRDICPSWKVGGQAWRTPPLISVHKAPFKGATDPQATRWDTENSAMTEPRTQDEQRRHNRHRPEA
jgi:hypothetical protein